MIKELVYDYFITNDEPRVYDINDIHFSPSSLTKCVRHLYYKYTNAVKTNPISEHSYLKMHMGNMMHEFIQETILKNNNKIKLLEAEIDKEVTLWGLKFKYRTDGIIQDRNNKKYILEIKSTYGNGMKFIDKFGADISHLQQLLFYMYAEKIPTGLLYYISRDNCYQLEFFYSKEKLENIISKEFINNIKKLYYLKKQILKKEAPGRQYKIYIKKVEGGNIYSFQHNKIKYTSDWQCTYCPYMNLCWKKELDNFKKSKNNIYLGEQK